MAGRTPARASVNTGLYRAPTSEIDGVVWDDTERDGARRADNKASDGVRDADEPGLAGETVLATQWYYVPAGAPAFAQIDTGAEAGVVEWVLANGTKTVATTVALLPRTPWRLGAERRLRQRLATTVTAPAAAPLGGLALAAPLAAAGSATRVPVVTAARTAPTAATRPPSWP